MPRLVRRVSLPLTRGQSRAASVEPLEARRLLAAVGVGEKSDVGESHVATAAASDLRHHSASEDTEVESGDDQEGQHELPQSQVQPGPPTTNATRGQTTTSGAGPSSGHDPADFSGTVSAPAQTQSALATSNGAVSQTAAATSPDAGGGNDPGDASDSRATRREAPDSASQDDEKAADGEAAAAGARPPPAEARADRVGSSPAVAGVVSAGSGASPAAAPVSQNGSAVITSRAADSPAVLTGRAGTAVAAVLFSETRVAPDRGAEVAAQVISDAASTLASAAGRAIERIARAATSDAADGAVRAMAGAAGPGIVASRLGFHFARVNAAATFGDSIGHFINECASLVLAPTVAAAAPPLRRRGWGVVIAGIAADVVLGAYVVRRCRRRAAPRKTAPDPFALPL